MISLDFIQHLLDQVTKLLDRSIVKLLDHVTNLLDRSGVNMLDLLTVKLLDLLDPRVTNSNDQLRKCYTKNKHLTLVH